MADNIFHVSLTDALRIADRISYGTRESSIPLDYYVGDDKTYTLTFGHTFSGGEYERKCVVFDATLTIQVDMSYGLAIIKDVEGIEHGLYFKKSRSINQDDL